MITETTNKYVKITMKEYAIHGGNEGSTRLDILSRTIEKSTENFLKTTGLTGVKNCLDLGCGTGKVSMMIAKLIGDQGQVLGLDINELNIKAAIKSAKIQQIDNVNFEVFDAYQLNSGTTYDVIYSRFLLSHLANPRTVLENALQSLTPGGKLLLEETDFSGHFCSPKSGYFDAYVSLYQDLLKKRGANANLGQRLVGLLKDLNCTNVTFQISQPAHSSGEGKRMAEITFKGISEALIEENMIKKEEFVNIHTGLVEFRKREDTIMSLPRIFQVVATIP